MQSSPLIGRKSQPFAPPIRRPGAGPEPKEITLKTLVQLKAKLYAAAAHACEQNPAKAEIIQKRADADAAHLAFAINMVQIKM